MSKGITPDVLYKITEEGSSSVRINTAILIKPESFKEDLKRLEAYQEKMTGSDIIINTAKFMMDGVIEGGTAYLDEDYRDKPGFRGVPNWDYDEFVTALRISLQKGFQIHVHAIGDAAVNMTIDAIEEAQKSEGVFDKRNVITHLQLVRDEDIPRLAQNGIIAAIQTFWHYKEPGFYDNINLPLLGETRSNKMYPAKSLKTAGVIITNSGDYPVSSENNPMLGIQIGITRNAWEFHISDENDERFLLNADERLSVKDMIEAYTINGAYQLFRENEIGSLEPGKKADYIVLDNDPFNVPHHEIKDIRVLETCLGGETVFKA